MHPLENKWIVCDYTQKCNATSFTMLQARYNLNKLNLMLVDS